MPLHLHYLAPTYGESILNAQGTLLLQFCHDCGLVVMSGSSQDGSGPTCVGHGRGAVGASTSVVDHIIGTQVAATSQPLPKCTTLTHADYAADLQGIDSDHCLMLQHVPRRPAGCTPRRTKTVRIRMERLDDPDARKAYQAAIAASPSLARLCALVAAPQWETQATADAASAAAGALFRAAATAILGTRTIVHGITKRWHDGGGSADWCNAARCACCVCGASASQLLTRLHECSDPCSDA